MEGGKRDRVTDRGGHPELPGTSQRSSPLQHGRGHIRKFGSLGPTGGRGGQRPGPSRGGETCLPLSLASPLHRGRRLPHPRSRHRAASERLPAIPDRLPHKTPQYNLLLLILQMLSHDHLHQHPRPLAPRRLAFQNPAASIPSPPHPDGHTAHSPQSLKQAARRTTRTPGSPVLSIFVLPTQARAHRATERAQPGTESAPSGLAGPAGDNGPRPASSPARRQSPPYRTSWRGERLPGGRAACSQPRWRRPFIGCRGWRMAAGGEGPGGAEPSGTWERELGPTREGRGREPRAHSAARAERGWLPLWFLGWAAGRGREAMLILSLPGLSHCLAAPPTPYPAPPPAIPTLLETQIPRSTFPGCRPQVLGGAFSSGSVPLREVTRPAPRWNA